MKEDSTSCGSLASVGLLLQLLLLSRLWDLLLSSLADEEAQWVRASPSLPLLAYVLISPTFPTSIHLLVPSLSIVYSRG